MSDVSIRAAQSDDLPAVEALLQAAALPVDGVRDFFPANYAIAERSDAVVGAIGVEVYGRHGLLRSVVVAPDERGSGLGSQLTVERLAWCRTMGLADAFLLTTTAAGFFEKLGFVAIERSAAPAEVQRASEFAVVCPSSAVVMRLDLS